MSIQCCNLSICQLKSIYDMFYRMPSIIGEQYGYDIKTRKLVMHLIFGKPGKGSLGNLALLEGIDRQLRYTIEETAPGFDFHKDQNLILQGNDVNLAPLATEVTFDNAVAVRVKIPGSDLFSLVSGLLAYVLGHGGQLECLSCLTEQRNNDTVHMKEMYSIRYLGESAAFKRAGAGWREKHIAYVA